MAATQQKHAETALLRLHDKKQAHVPAGRRNPFLAHSQADDTTDEANCVPWDLFCISRRDPCLFRRQGFPLHEPSRARCC